MLPWSSFWESNYFAIMWPVLLPLFTNHYVRGAVTGLGLVNLSAGISELLAMFGARDKAAGPPPVNRDAAAGGGTYPNPDARVGP